MTIKLVNLSLASTNTNVRRVIVTDDSGSNIRELMQPFVV